MSIYHATTKKRPIYESNEGIDFDLGGEEFSDDVAAHYEDIENFCSNDYLLDGCKEATLCKIAGNIEHTIRTKGVFSCRLCLNVFNENDCVSDSIIKNNGSAPPCVSTVHVCKIADKYLNVFKEHLLFNHERLLEIVIEETNFEVVFSKTDFSIHEEHKLFFVQCIVSEFIRIRATEIAKEITLDLQKKKSQQQSKKNATFHWSMKLFSL